MASTDGTPTPCPYCSLQCGMRLGGTVARPTVTPSDFPTNRGGMCAKGWSSVELLDHPERLTRPWVRSVDGDRSSPLVPSDWDTALDRLVRAVRATQARDGRDAVGYFGGGGLTNEQAYQFGKFARVGLRTRSIDYNGRWCMSSAAGAAVRAFGLDRGLPFPLADLAAADVVLLVGSNLAETMPPAMRHLAEGRAAGAFHVVVDPRRTPTAAAAGLHVQVLPGTDLALANGLLHLANGSTYTMIPAIFRVRAAQQKAAGVPAATADATALRLSGAAIGFAGAVGAFGGVLVNLAFRQSFLSSGSGNAAYLGFLVFYAVCAGVTWGVYLRRPRRNG